MRAATERSQRSGKEVGRLNRYTALCGRQPSSPWVQVSTSGFLGDVGFLYRSAGILFVVPDCCLSTILALNAFLLWLLN